MHELTVWFDPLDAPSSLQAGIDNAKSLAQSISSGARNYHANVLLPTHYGQWPQSECNQNLPPDMLVQVAADITEIRGIVESQGLGFGAWGVPLNQNGAAIAAEHATAAGYYVANFEPTASFWQPGDSSSAINSWWAAFWDGTDKQSLNGNVGVTLVPNNWGLDAFYNSDSALEGGANLLLLEAYGGPNTPEYPYPNLWPIPCVELVHAYSYTKPIACILARTNLVAQYQQAQKLGNGNIHVWYGK